MRKYIQLKRPTIGQTIKYAEAGDTDAMIEMAMSKGFAFYGFELKTETEEQEAVYWYTKAAEKGSIIAMRLLASMYDGFNNLTDPPEKTDYDIAEYWYKEAIRHGCDYSHVSIWKMKAKQGDANAMVCIAKHHKEEYHGYHQEWYEKAAELGHPEACQWMYNLYTKWKQPENAEKYKMASQPITITRGDHTHAKAQPTQPSLF